MRNAPWVWWFILSVGVLVFSYFMPVMLLHAFPGMFPDYEPGLLGNSPSDVWLAIIRDTLR